MTESIHRNTTVKKPHCPNCKSVNYTVTTEQKKSTDYEYNSFVTYLCSDCSTKFHNIQSVEEAIVTNKNSQNTMSAVTIVSAIVFLIFLIIGCVFKDSILWTSLSWSMCVLSPIPLVVCLVYSLVYKRKVKTLKQELDYLKENCFN